MREPGFAFLDRATDLDLRDERADALDRAAPEVEARPQVPVVPIPFIRAAPRFDLRNSSGYPAIFRRVGQVVHFDRLDRFERELDGELPRHRIRHVRAVHEQRGLTGTGAVEAQAPFGIPHDAGHERESLLETIARKRQRIELLRGESEDFLGLVRDRVGHYTFDQDARDPRDLEAHLEPRFLTRHDTDILD